MIKQSQIDDSLQAYKQRLQMVLEVTGSSVWELDLQARSVRSIGPDLTVEQAPEESFDAWQTRVHPDDMARLDGAFADLLGFQKPGFREEFRMRQEDGAYRWFLGCARLIRNDEGKPVRALGTIVDITERKLFEQDLHQSRTMLEIVLDNIPQRVFWKDTTSKYIGCNKSCARDAGLSQSESIIGKTDFDLAWKASADIYRADDKLVIESGHPKLDYEEPQQQADGRLMWLRTSKIPLRDQDDKVFGILGTYEDITGRKLAEDALRESEIKYRCLHDSMMDAFVSIDIEGRIHETNRAYRDMLGYSDEELRQLTYIDLTPESWHAFEAEVVKEQILVRDCSDVYEKEYRRKDGTILPVELRTFLLRDSASQPVGMWAIVRDITKRKRAEQELKRIEWMLQSDENRVDQAPRMLQATHEDLVALGTSRVILNAVGAAMLADIVRDHLDLLGTSAAVYEANGDYALGLLTSGWCQLMNLSSRRLCGTDDNREALVCGKWLCHESCWNQASRLCIESGKPVDIECAGGMRLYAVPIQAGGQIAGSMNFGYGDPPRDPAKLLELAAAFRVDVAELIEHSNAYASRPPFVIEMAKRRLQSSAQLIGEIVGRKRVEDEGKRLQSQLIQAQKMESIGLLAGGLAHDLNNLLTPILGYGQMLLGDFGRDDVRKGRVTEIVEASMRARDVVRQLLAFSRKQTLEIKLIDLNRVLTRFERLLRRTIREDIVIRTVLTPDLPLVQGDIGQLEQVIMNLAVNAQDAMVDGGLLTIETAVTELRETDTRAREGASPGTYVVLSVRDTGCGMDDGILSRIFEPFFTTKERGKGSGLGLATVHGIVKQHNGSICVHSEPNAGTTFQVCLPISEGAVRPSDSFPPVGLVDLHGSETILVVEDNQQVRDLVHSILTRRGYTVLVAESGKAALTLLDEHDGPVQLLLTDVVMPELNGRKLFERVRERCRDTKVLYMSGYTDDVIVHRGVLDSGVSFIQKPFLVEALAAKVREVLAKT